MEKFRCAWARMVARRKIAVGALIVLVAAVALLPQPADAASFTSPGGETGLPAQLTPRYAVLPMKNGENVKPALLATAGGTVPMWIGAASDGGTSYFYSMVGRDPSTASAATTIKAVLVPIKFTFLSYGNQVFDPSTKDPVCSPAASAVTRFKNSPLMQPISLTIGGTSIGTGEYPDLFQRANFWSDTQPGGVSPNYHTKIAWTVHAVYPIDVTGGAVSAPTGCGGALGALDINTWDAYLQGTVIPALGLKPNEFPFFLFYNVVMYDGSASDCCIIGYHSAEAIGGRVQTYGVGDYDTSENFSGLSDIASLTHETAEWMDDPLANNPTPAWGHTGQVSGCQSNLEVGDPLSGTIEPITLNGFTYHVQDLAFVSWFFRQSPSIGVNGQYSLYNNLTPQGPCS